MDGNAKYIDEFGYSGISIHVNSSTGQTATITVEIDNEITDINSTAEMVTGFSGSEFINDSNRILLATVYSPIELGGVTDIYLQSLKDDFVIPLEAVLSSRSNQLNLYVSNENAPLVKANEEYKINLQDSLKTYYGNRVDIMNFDGTVRFEPLPQAFISQGEISNGCQEYREFFYPEYFYLGDNIVSYFSVENSYLWLREIDVESNNINEMHFTLNSRLSRDDGLNRVTILDEKYYLLFWGPETNREQISLIELYSREGNLLDEYVMPSNGQLIRGESTNLTILIDFELYQVVFDESLLKLEKIIDWRLLDKVWWDGAEWYGIGFEYSDFAQKYDMVICNLESCESKYYFNDDSLVSQAVDVTYKDNKIYIITLCDDLKLYICDNEWNLLEEKVLLKDTGIDFITKMNIGFQGDSLWVKFDGIPATNIVWFSSTFLVTFDSDFDLENYYRNGESDTHYCGNILCLDGNKFFIGSTSTYKVLQRVSCDNSFRDINATDYFYLPVQWAVENGITNGYGSDTIFNPDGTCTRGQIVTFLWRSNGSPEPASLDNPFTDVPDNEYYSKAVLWAVENGITAGYGSDTIFNPDGACTRGQVVTFMWRATGKPGITGLNNRFTDISCDTYYYDAVLWAVENGITNGYGSDTIFNPDGNCTRGQIVTFLYRGMN